MTEARAAPLRISAERLARLVLENARDFAILTADMEGRISGWTPGAERVFKHTAAEAMGQPTSLLFTTPDRAAGADRQELETVAREGRAEDSRWHVRRNGEWFWGNGVSVRFEAEGVLGMLKIVRDETAQKRAEEQRVLLLNELNHRIKNTLATVQSITEQTLRAAQVDPHTRADLANRLVALSQAHNVLVDENWAGADLHAVVARTLQPHMAASSGRFLIEGPSVRLSPGQAVSMSLALHELATNALKYGALSVSEGHVRVSWNLALDMKGRRRLSFVWEEGGGPRVGAPAREGFGMRLINRTFSPQSGGRANVEYRPGGLCCVVELELSVAEDAAALDLELAKTSSAS